MWPAVPSVSGFTTLDLYLLAPPGTLRRMEPGEAEPLSQLRRGVLEYCVLALLREQERYGFELVRSLSAVDGLVTSEGTIYPLLTRLRKEAARDDVLAGVRLGPAAPLLPPDRRGRRGAGGVQPTTGPGSATVSTHCSPQEEGMTTMRRDPLVDDYLRRLEAAAADLPRERRAELVGEIEEHVDAALGEGGDDEAAVRNVLERLGLARGDRRGGRAAAGGAPRRAGALETAALIVLSVSFVLPVIGYLIGAALVLASKAWDGREKAHRPADPAVRRPGRRRSSCSPARRASPTATRSTPGSGRWRSRCCSPTSSRASSAAAVPRLAAAAAYGGVRRRMRSSSSSGSPRPSRLLVST